MRTSIALSLAVVMSFTAASALAQTGDEDTGTTDATEGASDGTAEGDGGDGGDEATADTADTVPAEEEGSSPAAETSAAPDDSEMDAGTYAVRLRDLEQRINELKEQIFRSKARLSLLAETVLAGRRGRRAGDHRLTRTACRAPTGS